MNWDPLHELIALHDRSTRRPAPPDGAWSPSADLLETDAAFLLVVELPGLRPSDFSITASADGLVIAGQRPMISPAPQRYLRMERGYGRFSRTIAFAEPIAAGEVQARFERGLLIVTVPKAGPATTRRIAIG
jgi:HSP20 family protein